MAEPSDETSSNAISDDEDFDFLANLTPEELAEVQRLRSETAAMQRQISHLELSNESKFAQSILITIYQTQLNFICFDTLVSRKRISMLDEEIAEKLHDYEQLLEATKSANQRLDLVLSVEKL